MATEQKRETIGAQGGRGGNAWDDGVNVGIRKMEIAAGDIVDSIRVEYDRNGTFVWSDKRGASMGGNKVLIELDYPNEFIVGVSGHHRNYRVGTIIPYVISALTIRTNKRTFGPYGGESGTHFSFPGPEKKIVGFHGRSGTVLDAIGAYVVPIPSVPTQPDPLPKPVKHNTIEAHGGPGGRVWDDGVHTGIRKLEIAAMGIVDSICIEYDKNGNFAWSEKRGESPGGAKNLIELDYPNEFIIGVSGHHRNYRVGTHIPDVISSLTIITNKRRLGPYGTESGTPFSFSEPGKKIVGFHGRSGTVLDAIGVHVVPISSVPSHGEPLPEKHNTIEAHGGLGGRVWDDGVHTGIRTVEIAAGDVIDSLRVEYAKNGTFTWSEKRGESTGGNKNLINLDYPNEFIIGISGHQRQFKIGASTHHVISSLTIKTNKKTYGPFGKEAGTQFSFPEPGRKIVGFHGRSGTLLDAIGVHVVHIPSSSQPGEASQPSKPGETSQPSKPGETSQPDQHEPVGPKTIEAYGGQGGRVWDDGVHDGIRKIEIAAGEVIDSIRVEYAKKGNFAWSDKRGKSTGGKVVTINLDYPNEFITEISGHHRQFKLGASSPHVISSLTIKTNKRTIGPFGKEAGTHFLFPESEGKIVGFHGKSDTLLDAIGAHVVPISSPTQPGSTPQPDQHEPSKHDTIEPYGGHGGRVWDDGVHDGIRKMEITAGEVVYSIRAEYAKNNTFVWSDERGQSGDVNKNTIELDYPNEFITGVSGHHRQYKIGASTSYVVSSLTIKTNKRTLGPFGNETGTQFSFPDSEGKIVGFHGRAGTVLDSIGAHVVSIPTQTQPGVTPQPDQPEPVSPNTIEAYGGQGGRVWDDGVQDGIRKIKIAAGEVIESIQVEYAGKGIFAWSDKRGKSIGGKVVIINLDYPNEFIIEVSGHHRQFKLGASSPHVISSLTIKTNKRTIGPFGKEAGTHFSFPESEGKIVGFHGRSDTLVDAIGAHVVPISSPTQPGSTPKPDQHEPSKHDTIEAYGGHGGRVWDDGVNDGIRKMEIAAGEVIYSIRAEYAKNNTFVWSDKRGESGDVDKVTIELDYPNEFIIGVSGHHRQYKVGASTSYVVSSLTIKTNKRTLGPFGKETGTQFSFPDSEGKIVGFHGRAATVLDSIGAHVVPIPK